MSLGSVDGQDTRSSISVRNQVSSIPVELGSSDRLHAMVIVRELGDFSS